jgi:hypothetical protein
MWNVDLYIKEMTGMSNKDCLGEGTGGRGEGNLRGKEEVTINDQSTS